MKVLISADIEGTCGIVGFSETGDSGPSPWYEHFKHQMSLEVAAACKGALQAGADEIVVKDAHGTAQNIDPTLLPESVRLIRGWSGHPLQMVEGLDGSFDAVVFTGYHSPAGSSGSPMSHTMSLDVEAITINGQIASEFTIHSYAAALLGVPVVFVSGDELLCKQAKQLVPGITAVATGTGIGGSMVSIHPQAAVMRICQGVKAALLNLRSGCSLPLPGGFDVQVRYKEPARAYKMAFYPGAEHLDDKTIRFASRDYREVLRFFLFTV